MPWKPDDAHQHMHGLEGDQPAAWAKIANSAREECMGKGGKDCDGYAIRVANAGVKRVKKIAERQDTSPEEGEHKYGDVTYADPKNKKYPINTAEHVRAALSYWGQAKNRAKYSSEDQKTIGARIHAAASKMGIGAEKRWVGTIAKVDESRGLVYGWASVAQNADGSLVEDSQGDIIEPGDLEDAAHDFMLHHRAVDEMHVGEPVGAIVESLVVTAEKMERMGIPPEIAETLPTGWWVGAKVPPDVFAKVRSGEYAGFSIGGSGRREPV